MLEFPSTRKQLVHDMRSCEQTKGLSVYQHGLLVNEYYKDLFQTPMTKEWKLPSWITSHRSVIERHLPSPKTMRMYHVFHDCGKPYCRTVDEEGYQHFPNHAQVSSLVWNRLFPSYPEIGSFIAKDMLVHTMPLGGEAWEAFTKYLSIAIPLLITALCEVHANASMFGGLSSDSFKMKWKKINKIGTRIFGDIAP